MTDRVPESDLDFSDARAVRKKSFLLKTNVRIADGEEKIDTVIEGRLERSGTTKKGDYVVTGGKGEQYIIKSEKWGGLYEEDPSKPDRFRSKNHGLAKIAAQDMTIVRADGTEIHAAAGNVLFRSAVTNTVNNIDPEIFGKDFGDDATPSPLAAVFAKSPANDATPSRPAAVSAKPPAFKP